MQKHSKNSGFHLLTTLEKQAEWAYTQVRHYADGIVNTISHADFLPNKKKLVKEAKQNLDQFLRKLQKSEVANKAKKLALTEGSKFLAMLDFPSKKDVAKLSTRLSQLEKRLQNISSLSK